MKILVICQYYYPEPFRLPDICQALAAMGHSVTVVTGTPNYPEGEIYPGYEKGKRAFETIEGVRVFRCPIVPRKTGAIYRFLNYYSFVFSADRFLRKCREDFDVVFVNQLSPVMMAQPALNWARRHGKKCVLYCLDVWPESLKLGGIREGSIPYRLFEKISFDIYCRADRVLVSSKSFIPYLARNPGLPPERIGYLPQYAEDLFGELPPQPQKDTVDFLFAGNIGVFQSVETIVEAARLLQQEKHIHIHIAGGGVSLDSCKARAEGLSNITFHGRRDLSEMPGFYAMADGLLISLAADPFMAANLPGKLQSYMAAGKPVIASLDGETARIVSEADCGLCSGAEDAAALAQNLRKAAASPEARKRWGENAKAYYEEHFRKAVFLASLLRELAGNG